LNVDRRFSLAIRNDQVDPQTRLPRILSGCFVLIKSAEILQTAACPGSPPLGIGRNAVINGALIDKNARIGDGVVITPEGKPENLDGENYYIRDGVVVVPKGAVIPAGTSI
jgi:ADP-glucose pyrophosphorylase